MIKKHFLQQILGVAILISFFATTFVSATDLTSTSFIVRDPLVGTGGSFGSSTSFQAFGSGDMTNIGRSTSTSFEGREGFLWYPYVIQGTFTATAVGSQANLSWGASTAGLGWNVSGYKTGIATVSGGPYTYTAHGLVTSYSYTGLTPGLYCFILQTLDAFSNVIATSPEQCVTISPTLTFTISNNSVQFGNLTSGGPRYANTTGGSNINSAPAHTMAASSNAPGGYTITYKGALLTSAGNNIPGSSSISGAGSAGTSQFGLSLSTSGSATIPSAYQQLVPTWSYIANTTTQVASTSGLTSSETFNNYYIANVSSSQPAGNYSTDITYVITGNF